MTGFLRYGVLALFTAASALLVVLSESAFYLAAGSDAAVDIYTPAAFYKWLAFGCCSTALYWALFGRRGPRVLRWAVFALFVATLGFATHAVMLNHKRGAIQEHWFFAVFDRVYYDVAEGPAHDLNARFEGPFVVLQPRSGGSEARVFRGFGPFRLDLEAALSPPERR